MHAFSVASYSWYERAIYILDHMAPTDTPTQFNSWGLVNAYGTYASYYKQYLLPGHDLLLFNLVGSTQSFVVLSLSAVVGRFLDAGYSRHLIATGTVLVSLGTYLLSIVNADGGYKQGNYALIWLTQGFISGLGMACFFVSSSQGKHESSTCHFYHCRC